LKIIALDSKDSKVKNIWLITGKELIGCPLEKLLKIEMVCGMTRRIDQGLYSSSIVLTISMRAIFLLSDTLFCCGE
jgi:hypothetical protein